MRAARVVAALIVGGCLALAAPSAGAQTQPTCTSTAIAFYKQHEPIWYGAGVPAFECDLTPVNGEGGWWDGHVVHVVAPAMPSTVPAGAYYREVVAHEMGHAWAQANKVDLNRYATIRGFPRGTVLNSTVTEDYAESFAYALGWWTSLHTGAPYEFKNAAGVPTRHQILALRSARLLPSH